MRSDFAVFILTHGRPDNVLTHNAIRHHGYTGPIFLVIDDEDKKADGYRERYGDEVLMFSKEAIARDPRYDQADNLKDRRVIFFARNACWDLARDVGVRYFVELDDDYFAFQYRRPGRKPGAEAVGYHGWQVRNLDAIFEAFIRFLESTSAATIAMAQGGDHFGGQNSNTSARLLRKAMNSFVLDTERPFPFLGRVNEDVNSYTLLGSRGHLFFTYRPLQLEQLATQMNPGGMSDMYLTSGTYVKSFYTVIHHPSSACIRLMGRTSRRLHHSINWRNTVPRILHERHRKPREPEPPRLQDEPSRPKRRKTKPPP